jgi:hypothetical protein
VRLRGIRIKLKRVSRYNQKRPLINRLHRKRKR